jgi:hypothetical protein
MTDSPERASGAERELALCVERLKAVAQALGMPRADQSSHPVDGFQPVRDRIRATVAERRGMFGAAGANNDLSGPQLPPLELPRLWQDPHPIPSQDEYSVGDLLAYNDYDFIRNAYRAILRREVDSNGLDTQLRSLLAGAASKVEILWTLSRSYEGQLHKVRIRGLALQVLLRRLRRIPVLGRILGILQYVIQLPVLVANIERHEILLHHRERELRGATQAAIDSLLALAMQLDRDKLSRGVGIVLSGRVAAQRVELARIVGLLHDAATRADSREVAEAVAEAIAALAPALASTQGGRDA